MVADKKKKTKLGMKALQFSDATNADPQPNRVCALPDPILIHILSYLPLKDAVRTSILSKMWQYLWTNMPELRFNNDCENIERALLHRDHQSPLKVFSLSGYDVEDVSRVNNLISAAINWTMEKLYLNLPQVSPSYALPSCIFRCETLVELVLELDEHVTLWVPSSLQLPNLKILHLKFLKFADDASAAKLLSCPLLEELHLRGCNWTNIRSLRIAAPRLIDLNIEDSSGYESYDDDDLDSLLSVHRHVSIDGPCLKYFIFSGQLINDYCIVGASLELAKIEIQIDYSSWEEEMVVVNHAYKLLSSLSTVKILILEDSSIDALRERDDLEEALNALPEFSNMTHLKVHVPLSFDQSDWTILHGILRKSPSLQTFQVFLGPWDDPYEPETQWDPLPSCFSTRLKKIQVAMTTESSDELLRVARIWLEHSIVLEEMVLHIRRELRNDDGFLQKLRELPRSSKKCKIFLDYDDKEKWMLLG